MNLKLNVVRFENEDVIATSIDCTGMPHFMQSTVKCTNTAGNHNYNEPLMYVSFHGVEGGVVSCQYNDIPVNDNVWYHFDGEGIVPTLIPCTKNHSYNPTFDKDNHGPARQ